MSAILRSKERIANQPRCEKLAYVLMRLCTYGPVGFKKYDVSQFDLYSIENRNEYQCRSK